MTNDKNRNNQNKISKFQYKPKSSRIDSQLTKANIDDNNHNNRGSNDHGNNSDKNNNKNTSI